MKIGERFHDADGSKFVVEEIHDFTPTVERVKQIRERGNDFGESKHIGRIPMKLFYEWLKEAGVKPDDTKAAQEVLKRKLMDGEFSAFRNWGGSW